MYVFTCYLFPSTLYYHCIKYSTQYLACTGLLLHIYEWIDGIESSSNKIIIESNPLVCNGSCITVQFIYSPVFGILAVSLSLLDLMLLVAYAHILDLSEFLRVLFCDFPCLGISFPSVFSRLHAGDSVYNTREGFFTVTACDRLIKSSQLCGSAMPRALSHCFQGEMFVMSLP